MDHKKRLLIFFLAEAIVLAVMICLFSSQTGEQSSLISTGLTRWLYEHLPHGSLSRWKFHVLVRKAAHFTEFMALGQAVSCVLACALRGGPSWRAGALALVLCALYAAADEYHQLFVAGRSGAVKDVMIDCGGALTGIVLSLIALWLVFRRQAARKRRMQSPIA